MEKAQESAEGKKTARVKKPMSTEMQVAILFGVLFLVFASFLISYQFFKPSSSFKFSGFTVSKARLEGTVVDFYFIPVQLGSNGQPFNVMIRSDPRELENITSETAYPKSPRNWLRVWITTNSTYDSYAIISQQEVGRFTSSLQINTKYAFTKVDAGEYPERDCSDADKSSGIKVIDLRISENGTTRIYDEGFCTVIEAKDFQDMIKASDKYVIDWLLHIKSLEN